MVVIGNPPYSGHSANKGEWMEKLLDDYKQEPGGGKLQEKNPKWLNDDYVKFIRYGEYFIEKNGEGILAYINNHSFLDNPTFRGMRWHLLNTFDKIYILDLHGNSKKKEICPDGSADKNVFDIQQGVSVNLFVKTGKKKKDGLAKVFHSDLFGERDFKYDYLSENNIKTACFTEIELHNPYYFFVQKDFATKTEYDKGFPINELFQISSVGIVTSRDAFVTDIDKKELENRIKDFFISEKKDLERKYYLKENKSWKIEKVKNNSKHFSHEFVQKLSYRPFENRYLYYDPNFIERSRSEVMQHFLKGGNVGLMLCRQFKSFEEYHHVFITQNIFESSLVSNKTSEISYGFPLYIYPKTDGQQIIDSKQQERTPNLNMKIVQQIADKLGLTFAPEEFCTDLTPDPFPKGRGEDELPPSLWEGGQGGLGSAEFFSPLIDSKQQERTPNLNMKIVQQIADKLGLTFAPEEFCTDLTPDPFPKGRGEDELPPSLWEGGQGGLGSAEFFSPLDILDYIYAVLHSPAYREKYREFLKIDFPRVPYPQNAETFWQLIKLGKEMRTIHLLENPIVEQYITTYPQNGNNIVTRKISKKDFEITDKENQTGRVWINDQQYFDNVPNTAWEFYIGGYQPAQKWLKDRHGRTLSFDDILHYQKIIKALTETDRIMKEIDSSVGALYL